MLSPDVQQEIVRREGDFDSRATGEAVIEHDEFRQVAWETWLTLGAQLQDGGVPPNAMCDAVNTIATVRAEALSAEGTRTATA
jgi:hypothetical protein